jgi:hypothetical protein
LVAKRTVSGTAARGEDRLRRIGEPGFGEIQAPINESVAMGTGIAHEHPDLAVVDPPEGAAVLAADARRMDPLLGEARVVEDEHPARGSELLPHEALQLADAALVVPGRVGQELLELARRRPDLLGDVLDVLALDRQDEPDQVLASEGSPLRAPEEAGEAGVEAFERWQQGFEILVGDHGNPFRSGPPGQTESAALSGSHRTVNQSDCQ